MTLYSKLYLNFFFFYDIFIEIVLHEVIFLKKEEEGIIKLPN